MKRGQLFYRPVLVGMVALTCCLLVVALFVCAHSVRATLAPPRVAPSLQSPSAVTRATLPRSTAAYNGVITPAQTIYAPWLLGGRSVLRVHNTGGDTAIVRVTFTYDGGVTTTASSLAANAVGEITLRGMLTGTELSAVITGTYPIVAVVNNFSDDRMRATSYAAMPASQGRSYIALPYLPANNVGWSSKPAVQNVGAMNTAVTIVYTQTYPFTVTTWSESVQDLAPGQAHVFDPDAYLPDFFEGIAIIKSETGQPLVAVVNNSSASYNAYIYSASLLPAASGSRSLYFPMLVNAFEDWQNSEIRLLNAGPAEVSFNLEIDQETWIKLIDSWRGVSFLQNVSGSQSPPGEAVAGRVEDVQSLYGLVWLRGNFQGDWLAAYSPPSVGAKTWYLPYSDQGDDFATYVAVQNLSDVTAHITRTYYNVSGTLSSTAGDIAPSGMELYPASSGFVGGVVVEADQSVTAVAVIAGRLVLDEEIYLPVVAKDN